MHFLSAVDAHDHIVAFPIGKIHHLFIHVHTVGGQGEAEVLAGLFFNAAGIRHRLFHHIKIHQRLSTEEVNL